MSGTLIVAEHLRGRLRDVTRELVTAAQDFPRPVCVAVIAADPGPLAAEADLRGVDEIVSVRTGGDEFENDVYRYALEALLGQRKPDVVLTGFTVNSMGYAPAVAAKLGLGFASDVFAASLEDGSVIARRAFYGSKVHADVELPARGPVILMLRPTVWAPGSRAGALRRASYLSRRSPHGRAISVSSRDLRPTSTSPQPNSCSRSAGASAIRRTSTASCASPLRWAPPSRCPARSSTPGGCRPRARSASRARP